MTQEVGSSLYESLDLRGISRRDFLKFCGTVAAMLGLAETAAPRVAAAIEKGAALKPAIWMAHGLCTGCTESVAQSNYPDAATIVLDILSVNYWETLSAPAGEAAEQAITDTIDKSSDDFVLIVEGSIMEGFDGNALRVAGKTGVDALKEVAAKAQAILAVGSCAVDGGWVRANPNPAGATGVMQVAEKLGFADKPLINLPTCPVNPVWVVAVLVDFLLLGKLPELDDEKRPTFIFGQTIHDNCPRRGHFENGEFVEQFGSAEEAMGYCLYKMGCKGPQTQTNCPIVRWNRKVNWCVESGSPCIGCGNFNWVDNDAPFFDRMPDIAGIAPETIGLVAGGAVAAGLVVHGIAQVATGRMGHGAPLEDEKKGGDE